MIILDNFNMTDEAEDMSIEEFIQEQANEAMSLTERLITKLNETEDDEDSLTIMLMAAHICGAMTGLRALGYQTITDEQFDLLVDIMSGGGQGVANETDIH